MQRILCVFLIWAPVWVTCKANDPTVPEMTLTNRTWKLHSIKFLSGETLVIDNPEVYTLLLDDSLRVRGRADCNTCGGVYQISGSALTIQFGCTKKGCGPDSRGWQYFEAVNQVFLYRLTDEQLQLFFDGGTGVLYFTAD